ncbi:MAG: glutamine-hydrolyzing carbamoyl-phosphate synthase small subunit [Armatimonadetes bacterium]|nr:glutamine-hydrolyzing carbamoyl-phosphate synthase small subunit [Armatimonadota bacterium]
MKAYLVLSNGAIFEGESLGSSAEIAGEVVFNTGMTGYQEILTDPSYAGQIVNFTYPMIGNYGINEDDFESDRLQPAGVIVHEACETPSNWRSNKSFAQLLEERGMTGIQGIDTRAVTRLIRGGGATMGLVTTDLDGAIERLSKTKTYDETDFVGRVSTRTPYVWGHYGREKLGEWDEGDYRGRIIALDCGLKYNILRRFAALGVKTMVVPATTPAEEILEWNPDAVLLSPGPGDPARLGNVVQTVRDLLDVKPLFGICLGNQLLCHALGGHTFKLKFGHRGSNHPVKDLLDGTVTITSQNHGYAVDPDSLAGTEAEITQVNLNDGTVEGIRAKNLRASSIQYHPEAAPGPWDSRKYFVQFVEEMVR